ncbi:hypothetical protein ABIE67_009934 [Streptomyces sp. V4I8]
MTRMVHVWKHALGTRAYADRAARPVLPPHSAAAACLHGAEHVWGVRRCW